jgi:hypothetical protein
MPPEERRELREKARDRIQRLSPEEKNALRERIKERRERQKDKVEH